MDRSKFLSLFVEEAREHLAGLEGGLSALGAGASAALVAELFRHAHSLKGMAASMGYDPIRDLAHGMEEALDRVRSGAIVPTPPLVGALGGGIDGISAMVEAAASGSDDLPAATPWLTALGAAMAVQPAPPAPVATAPAGVLRPPASSIPAGREPVAASSATAATAAGVEKSSEPKEAAEESGAKPARLSVALRIRDDAPMPAARALVLLRQLSRAGRIVDRLPPSEEPVESSASSGGSSDGSDEASLRVVIETLLSVEELQQRLDRNPEVASATVTRLDDQSYAAVHPAEVPADNGSTDRLAGNGFDAGRRGSGASPPRSNSGLEPGPLDEITPAGAPRAAAARSRAPAVAPLRIGADVLDRFLDAVGELVILRGRIARVTPPDEAMRRELERLRKVSERLFRDVMRMRLVAFDSVAHRYQAAVRDLSRQLGRPLVLRIRGGEVRLDRAMLDGLADPIQHLLRNCAGHGIEDPAERESAGKPATGTISIALERSSEGIRVRVADDGRGMDPDRIRRHAIAAGFVTVEQASGMSDEEALALTTIPGFSTAGQVTELAGRGVGMDVVRTAVESLGGKLVIRSASGSGTVFDLSLPLTTAIVQAFLVRARGRTWAVPLSSVRRTIALRRDALAPDGTLWQDGEPPLPVHELERLIEFGTARPDREGRQAPGGGNARTAPVAAVGPARATSSAERGGSRPALVVARATASGERFAAVLVDAIVAQQDIVVKPLGPPLNELRAYTGATQLEDGSLALILDLANIVPSFGAAP